VRALVDGIMGSSFSINEATIDSHGLIKHVTEKYYEISSPSKVMQKIGEYITQGLGIGISDGSKYATKAMEEIGDGVKDASKSLSKIGDGAKDYTKSLDAVGDATDKVNKKRFLLAGFSLS
jgi:hypothetical protein